MTFNEEQCPTCGGSGFIAPNDQCSACPTCSPTTSEILPYPAPIDRTQGSTLPILRFAAYLVGAAALIAVLALVIKELWK